MPWAEKALPGHGGPASRPTARPVATALSMVRRGASAPAQMWSVSVKRRPKRSYTLLARSGAALYYQVPAGTYLVSFTGPDLDGVATFSAGQEY